MDDSRNLGWTLANAERYVGTGYAIVLLPNIRTMSAASYVAHGGKVIEVTIPRSTLNQMYYNGALEYKTGIYYGGSKPYTEYMFSPTVKSLILNH